MVEAEKNVLLVSITTEPGCCFDEGEFLLAIYSIEEGWIGEEDFDLVDECVVENLSSGDLPEEGSTCFKLTETGEWEDVRWLKYYEITERLGVASEESGLLLVSDDSTSSEKEKKTIERAQKEILRLRKLIREDHPGIGLSNIAMALSEPMECGHHVDCLDDDTSECGYCKAIAGRDALREVMEEISMTSTSMAPGYNDEVSHYRQIALNLIGKGTCAIMDVFGEEDAGEEG